MPEDADSEYYWKVKGQLQSSLNWNLMTIVYGLIFEVLCYSYYTKWAVFGLVFGIGIIPSLLNITFICMPGETKRSIVAKDNAVFVFYIVEAIFFCVTLGSLSYFLASTITYEWKEDYLWSNAWLGMGVFLSLMTLWAALHAISFIMLLYRYRSYVIVMQEMGIKPEAGFF